MTLMQNYIFSLILCLIFINPLSAQNENTINEIEFKINKVRNTGHYCGEKYFPPADPVCWSNPLFESAKHLVEDNNNNGSMSHYSKNGQEDLSDRVKKIGYPTHTIGEIILAKVDRALIDKGYNFIRFIDDYSCYVGSFEEAENFFVDLSEELKNTNLN